MGKESNRKMHVGLNVSDIEQTTRFYETLFNQKADKARKGYAKFDLPELVISFIQTAHKPEQNFGHFGFQLESSEIVTEELERIKALNIPTLEEDKVKCCYALQDKFWVTDPDGFRWELYSFIEDVEENDGDQSTCCPEQTADKDTVCCTDEEKDRMLDSVSPCC